MAWERFRWGSRGIWWKTGVEGIYVAHIPIPNGIRTVLQVEDATYANEQLNVFNFMAPSPSVSAADCAAVNAFVKTWWDGIYHNMCNVFITGRQIVSTGMDVFPAAQATTLLTQAGSRTGNPPPQSVTFAVKFASGVASRRHRGRHYAFSATNTDIVGDIFTTSYINAIVGTFNDLIASAQAAGYPLVIASMVDAKLYPVSQAVAVDTVVDSQRRRLVLRGR